MAKNQEERNLNIADSNSYNDVDANESSCVSGGGGGRGGGVLRLIFMNMPLHLFM